MESKTKKNWFVTVTTWKTLSSSVTNAGIMICVIVLLLPPWFGNVYYVTEYILYSTILFKQKA